MRPLAAATCVALALSACAVTVVEEEEPPPPRARRRPRPPGPDAVRSAVADLTRELDARAEPWPSHLPRSLDFPALPLARIDRVEDLGHTEADVDRLQELLEATVRAARRLRLAADEAAVPPSLRELDPGAPPGQPPDPPPEGEEPRPGLALRAWTDRAGRLQLELFDLVLERRVARARSAD